jgi:hypothetical protein
MQHGQGYFQVLKTGTGQQIDFPHFFQERVRHSALAGLTFSVNFPSLSPFYIWGLDLMILMGTNLLLGPLGGVELENLDFFGSKWHLLCLLPFQGPKKSLVCLSPPLPMAFEMDLPASKSYKQQVH